MQSTATLLVGHGQWNSHNALPQSLCEEVSETRAMHGGIFGRQWVAELLQCTATLPKIWIVLQCIAL